MPPETQERFMRQIFHGTSPDNTAAIVKSMTAGYLPYLAGSAVGAIWGDGTYFTHDARYSHDCTNEVQGKRSAQDDAAVCSYCW
jgi:hypothetical protein